jgi:predicted porin
VSPSPVHFTLSLEFFMKKTMVMAACLMVTALGAQAQSSVQLMGLADGYVGSIRMAGDAKSSSVMRSGGMTTSWWGMKGTEDLGNGLKANVAFTGFLQIDSGTSGRFAGDTMFSRDANVGLSGAFGTVTAGRGLAPNFLPTVIFNPIGDSFAFSPLVLHANVPLFNPSGWAKTTPDDTGWSSEVIYTTPNFSGLSANLHYQVADVAGASGKNNVGFNALYFAGPLALTAFWERDQLKGPVLVSIGSTKTDWMLGGSYDAKVAKAYMTYGQSSTDLNSTKGKTLSLGVSAPISANGKLLAAYATTKMTAGNTRDTLTVGYDHNLSKRTDVYAMVMHDQITTFSSGTSVGVGVRHRF